jgi:4-amino-4-deoxy-L-arabinose transferase-like glycosyltransferase
MRLKKLEFFDFLFIAFILYVAISNVAWFKTDNSIRGVDSPNHLLFSIDFFYRFSEALHKNTPILEKISSSIKLIGTAYMPDCVYWPQGLNLTTFIFYSLLGKSLFAAKIALLPYLLVLLFSTYSIGRLLYSKFVGFMAAFFLFFYPVIFQSSRQYQLDLPLTALVTLSIYFLLKVDQFKNAKYSFLLGLACGFAMLIKGQAVLFIVCPFFYVLYCLSVKSGKEIFRAPFKSKQLRNLLMALFISVLIAAIWWGPRISKVVPSFEEHIIDSVKNLENTPFTWNKKYSIESVLFYLWTLFYSLLRPFFSMIFIIFLPVFLIRKIKHKGLYLNWIIPPLLLFSLVFTIKHSRFLMPILPALALITALGLQYLQNKKVKFIILTTSVIFSLLQFYILSYDDGEHSLVSIGRFKIFGENGFGADYGAGKPVNEDLKMDDLVSIIRNNETIGQAPKILIIDMSNVRPNYNEMCFWLKIKDPAFIFTNLIGLYYLPARLDFVNFVIWRTFSQNPIHWFEVGKYKKTMHNPEALEIKYFEVRSQVSGEIQEWENFLKSLEAAASNFFLIGKVAQQDTTYYIYKKNAEIGKPSKTVAPIL